MLVEVYYLGAKKHTVGLIATCIKEPLGRYKERERNSNLPIGMIGQHHVHF